MQTLTKKLNGNEILSLCIFAFSIIAVGTFYETISCLVSLLLIINILLYARQNQGLHFKVNFLSIAVLLLIVSYGIVSIWAVDSGMAFLGFLKFLPVPLFLITIYQNTNLKGLILSLLPYLAAVITVLTAGLMQIPAFENLFSVSGRLAGCFEYPNAFAMLLLISELLLLSKTGFRWFDYITLAVLVFGILYTGSRTAFILTIAASFVMLLSNKNKRIRILTICLTVSVLLIVLLISLFFGDTAFNRFLTISLKESTFVGRLLYYQDALPVIVRHPFGLGYMGYYYLQQSIQTGVYSIRHIHNDVLQFLLDVGWLPTIGLGVAFVGALVNKKIGIQQKIIAVTFLLHICFDFDLQFVVMLLIMVLLLETDSGKVYCLNHLGLYRIGGWIIAVMNVYFCIVFLLFQFGSYSTVLKLYPGYTDSQIEILKTADTLESMNQIADDILRRNSYVSLAYSAKARVAYSKGDFQSVIQYKHIIFDLAPFAYQEYEDYCYMLIQGIRLYEEISDRKSVQICQQELLRTCDTVASLNGRLSHLATMIVDQPNTQLPDDILQYASSIR